MTDLATATPANDDASATPELTPAGVRAKENLSTAEMAALLGMSETGYTQWEDGTRRPGGPAYRLLHLINRDGKPIIEALRELPD